MDTFEDFMMTRPPTASRPLLGLTVLVVEDSLFACEALRLLCLRSGARIRRADNLAHARQHLRVYRPSVVIVDLGLPDGPGTELLSELDRTRPRVSVLLSMSADPAGEQAAMKAGADGFIAKPIASLSEFQAAILRHLPAERRPRGPRPATDEQVYPDRIALRDDLIHVQEVLLASAESSEPDEGHLLYVAQFLGGIARASDDGKLDAAATALAVRQREGHPCRSELAALTAIVRDRIRVSPTL